MSPERLDHIIAGALFDFIGFLTTKAVPITVSARHEVPPIVEALKEFMELRGVDQTCEPMTEMWVCRLSGAHSSPIKIECEPVIVTGVTPKIKSWYATGGSLVCDAPIEGITVPLSDEDCINFYTQRNFIGESMRIEVAEVLSKALNLDFQGAV